MLGLGVLRAAWNKLTGRKRKLAEAEAPQADEIEIVETPIGEETAMPVEVATMNPSESRLALPQTLPKTLADIADAEAAEAAQLKTEAEQAQRDLDALNAEYAATEKIVKARADKATFRANKSKLNADAEIVRARLAELRKQIGG